MCSRLRVSPWKLSFLEMKDIVLVKHHTIGTVGNSSTFVGREL